MIKTVGILGYGSFGQFIDTLVKEQYPDVRVFVWSRSQEVDGKTFFSFEETCSADIVVLAVSISALEEIVQRAVLFVRSDAILIDVSTVKMHPVSLLQTHAQGKKYIATHPMFGPYSYIKKGKTLNGLRIVLAEHTLTERELEYIKKELAILGLVVLETSAKEHDTMLAETLFLTHYIGQVVTKAGFVRTDIDTVSFGFLMDAVESVKHDTKLFEEVYKFNPFCAETIQRFETAEQTVRTML